MDLRKIKKLIELVEESGITELEVKSGDEAVRIARPGQAGVAVAPVSATVTAAPAAAQNDGADLEVRAPMAGTFYQAPEPGADPFVQPGDQLEAHSVVCIIESMKMMNEIRLPDSARCVEVRVANGEPVSTGQLLFRFRSGA